MNRTAWYIIGGVFTLLLVAGLSMWDRARRVLDTFIPSVEGFSSTPYWDVNAWRWGYGTPAPGPDGTITRQRAFDEMITWLKNDYDQLSPYIQRGLSANQWAAYLSFSYNAGIGAARKLVDNINSGNDTVLGQHWKQYVFSGGTVNQTLVDRRNREWGLWIT